MNLDRLRPNSHWILSTAGLLLLVGGEPGRSGGRLPDSDPAGGRAGCTTRGFPTAVQQIAAGVRPAVVQITTEQVQVGQFNRPFAVPSGVGSGVLYDSQGHSRKPHWVTRRSSRWATG